jgi:hypothetical protein
VATITEVPRNSYYVSIFLGTGDNQLAAPVNYPAEYGAYQIVVGDFNRDGHPDLAVVSNFGGVQVFFNNGNGTFGSPVSYETSGFMVVGDFNGDGYPDIAVAGNPTAILLNQGNGTFQSTTAPIESLILAVGDFNGDGKLDLVASNYNTGLVSVLLGNGDGTFQTAINTTVTHPWYMAIADLNGDGKQDIAISEYLNGGPQGYVQIFLGNGNGTFSPGATYNGGAGPLAPLVADFNGDGIPDIAATSAGLGSVRFLWGAGNGTFHAGTIFQAGEFTIPAGIGQFSSSSVPDIAFGTSTGVGLLLNKDPGKFFAPADTLVGDNNQGIALGDFNGDGTVDVAIGHSAPSGHHVKISVNISLNDGSGMFNSLSSIEIPSMSRSYAFITGGDFNGDGKLDAAVAYIDINYNERVGILLGGGGGTLVQGQTYEVGPSGLPSAQIVTADFNHDGKLDIATSCGFQLCVLLGSGDGTFKSPVAYESGGSETDAGPAGIAVGDVNHDGNPDLVVTNAGSFGGATAILLGNADGTFQAPIIYTDPDSSYGVVLGDFNGDGNLDIARIDRPLSCCQANNVYLLLGNGDGTFQAATFVNSGETFIASIGAADFNEDGNLDIVVAGQGSQGYYTSISVLHGNGKGSFGPPIVYPSAETSQTELAIASLTGKPNPDIVTSGTCLGTFLNVLDF